MKKSYNSIKIAALFAMLSFCGMAQSILGVDVSDYQGTINWTNVKNSGITFAFAKATESTGNVQTTLGANITNGEAAGVYMGAYHFARILSNPGTSGAIAEANHFLSVAGSYITTCQMPPVLDYEVNASGTYTWAQQAAWIQTWCNTVQSATGVTPIIYSGNSIAQNLGSYLSSQYKLWYAYYYNSYTYTTPPPSTYYGTWGSYKIWQYSDQGTVSGISGGVDMDIFNGTMSDLTALMSCNAPAVCNTYYASIPYSTSFESWIADSCVAGYPAGRLPDIYWKSSVGGTSSSGNDYWHREDYTGSDWTSVTTGSYSPSASNGSHSARFRNYQSTAASTGSLDLYLNLMPPGVKTIKFDYIHNEAAAAPFQLQVLLSTDGGSTFPTTLYTITTASVSSWTTQTFTTNATSTTSVLRFVATDKGLNDVGIDNFNITYDMVAPTTSVSISNAWETQTFTTTFTDTDNTGGSGIEKGYYQAIYYDGANWSGNYTHGFYADDFNGTTINTNWTQKVGTWSINSNALYQSDQTQSNTNIYAPLTQTLSNRYLYYFTMKIGGTGTSRRAGFHFFCDKPDSTNRNNSYFVWFRADDKLLQIYKVVNNNFGSAVFSAPMAINANQNYDYIVVYDRISGAMRVYQNNVLIGSWTDPSPYSTGGYISFRSANATMSVDQLRVYRSRSSTVAITLGSGNGYDLEYQNTNPTTPAAHINSICNDNSGNLSAIVSHTVNVDWTPPTGLTTVTNGSNTVCANTTSLTANWSTASDVNSGIAYYKYAIGSTPGAQDVVAWTNNGLNTAITETGLSLTQGQQYYFTVKAVDGADLVCDSINGTGVAVANCTTGIEQLVNNGQLSIYPNPTNSILNVEGLVLTEKMDVLVYDVLGKEVMKRSVINTKHLALDVSVLTSGVYFLRVGNSTLRFIKQ
ncbi:MAG: GH25 family lysozyme [Bacteroidia bacterium]